MEDLEAEVERLKAEVEHWKGLWRQNLENAQQAFEERDAALYWSSLTSEERRSELEAMSLYADESDC